MKSSNFGITFSAKYKIENDTIIFTISGLEFAKSCKAAFKDYNPNLNKRNGEKLFIRIGALANFNFGLLDMFDTFDFFYHLLVVIEKKLILAPISQYRYVITDNLGKTQGDILNALIENNSLLENIEKMEFARYVSHRNLIEA